MFDLTRQERQALMFLLAVSLAGAGTEALIKRIRPGIREELLETAGKVDLNTAGPETLKSLPGVGESLARRIIEYRESNNGFEDIEELGEIKGLTKSRIGRLKDCVYIR